MKKSLVWLLLLIFTIFSNAKSLEKEGWNLVAVCQDMNMNDINMTGLIEVQSQDGEALYSGEDFEFSDLTELHAGYGYWVKGSIGSSFNTGIATSKLINPLRKNGWNLMAICEDFSVNDINMSGLLEVQSQVGEAIYSGEDFEFSDLTQLHNGTGYWVNGTIGINFLSKRGLSIPSTYIYPTLNSTGGTVVGAFDNFTIKLFSDSLIVPNPQSAHTKVAIYVNGEQKALLNITEAYRTKSIVAGIYDNESLIAVSDIKTVEASGVTRIDITSEEILGNNTAPVLTPIPNQTMNTNTLTLDVNATDADNDTITFDANSSDSASVTASMSGKQLTLTRLISTAGTVTITVKATDDKGASDVKSFTVTLPSTVTDTENPIVTLNGSATVNVTVGEVYTELNATVTDNVDTGLIASITGNVDTAIVGSYTLTYTATDTAGNVGTATRVVNVVGDTTCTPVTDTYPTFTVAKSNTLSDVSALFNGLRVDVTTDTVMSETSTGTMAIYGIIDGNNTGALLKLNGNYPVETQFVVKVYRDNVLVGISNVVTGSGALDFGNIQTQNCGNGTPISEEMMNTFAGKTFYATHINKSNVGIIGEIICDEHLSSLTWEEIRGGSESGSSSIRVEGNRLYIDNKYYVEYIEQVDNYLLLHDYKQDANGSWIQIDTTRLYFNLNDAESYLATLNGGNPPAIDLPNGYSYRAINNLGTEVETAVEIEGNSYTLQLYSDINISANDQANHVGIMISVNGQTALLQIQNSYETHDVVLAVYDVTGQLVAVSSETTVNGNTPISLSIDHLSDKPKQILSGDITIDQTLTADKTWLLDGQVKVEDGVTLTIEPGTTVAGKSGTNGWLMVLSGAKIMAEGTAAKPILFTSEEAVKGEAEAAGQWGGLTLIGNSDNPQLASGYEVDATIKAGTGDASSGSLKYVTIDNSGIAVQQDKEINGLSLFGVSASTTVENITTHRSGDDGIEIWGGTVNLKTVKIDGAQDDSLDTDLGWTGTVDGLTITNGIKAGIEMSGTTVGTYKNVSITIDSADSEGGLYFKAGDGEVVGGVFEDVNITYNSTRLGAITVRGNFDNVNSSMTNVTLEGSNRAIVAKSSPDDDAETAEVQAIFDTQTTGVFNNALKLKKTGQTKSYDADGNEVLDGTQKDDGFYQTGADVNYTRDDVTEIVTDHLTGLMWQDDAAVASVTKPWVTQANYDAGDYNNTIGDTATTYCNELVMGGYEDWRLPTRKELQSLADYGHYNPAINTAFVNVASSYYWSSSTHAYNSYHAWDVNFNSGNQHNGNKRNSLYVRCVRAGQ